MFFFYLFISPRSLTVILLILLMYLTSLGSALGPALFIINFSFIDFGLSNTTKFADVTNIGNAVLTECDRWSLQEVLHKISDWSVQWDVYFNINKCQILQIGSVSTKDYKLCGVKRKNIQPFKILASQLRLTSCLPSSATSPLTTTNKQKKNDDGFV